MASTFEKAFATNILDKATASMKGRRESLDAMTEQTLSVIPAAIAEKKKLEENQKIRRQKAENFLKINPSLRTLEMSMSFLNQFDPKNDQNVVDLSSVLQQVNFDNQQKLTQTKTLPPSVTLPSDQTGGNFLDRFRDPTIADALREGEKKLGLGTGDAEAALNLVNPANRPVDPNRFQLSGSGIFSPKALRDSTTTSEENTLIDRVSSNMGINYSRTNSSFMPMTLIDGTTKGGDDLALSIVNSGIDSLNHLKTTGIFNGGTSTNEYKGTPISGKITQKDIDFSIDVGNIGGFITQFGAYNIRGMGEEEFNKYINNYININPVYRTVLDRALQGEISYGAYNNAFKKVTGKDIEYEDANGKMVSITVGNKEARPDFDVAQKLLLEEEKLDQKTIDLMTQSQTEWDAVEERKLKALKNVIGEEHFNDLYLSIYGTGDFNTSYERIDDGLSSLGNYNIEENFVNTYGSGLMSASTIKEHKQNLIGRGKVETMADRTGGKVYVSGQSGSTASRLSEEEFDNYLKRGLIPILTKDGYKQKMRFIAAKDMEINGVDVKAGNEIENENL